jgi:hypothetical protein
MLDIGKMKQITEQLHVVAASKQFGRDGSRALADLISAITRIYKTIEPALRRSPLTVFICPAASPELGSLLGPAKATLSSPDLVTHELDGACIVEVSQNSGLSVFEADGVDTDRLSKHAIVYEFDNLTEFFCIDGERYRVTNPAAQPSVYAAPTYSSLADALQRFSKTIVLNNSCFILEECWADEKRIFLKPGPEKTMRRSLHQYLRNIFPDAEVRPEQVVDESHPVDIKVTWNDTNKRALIEIKWLGKSLDTARGEFTSQYTDNRARSGAKQLADYMDGDRAAAPGVRSRGYLVVIDARRRRANVATKAVTTAQGLYYRDREIAYDPEYHKIRHDFEVPIRMFAEPILN